MTKDDNDNRIMVQERSKPAGKKMKKWKLLVMFSGFILADLLLMIRLHPLPSDLGSKNKHLEDFLNGSHIYTTEKSDIITIDQPSYFDPPTYQFHNSSIDPFYNISSDGTNLWDDEPNLSPWIKAYFNWHKHKRKHWNGDDWESERWMIMQCLADQDKRRCGGTADRIKTVPTALRMAYETHRILLIRWTRPAMLEEFLVPPKGGFDWRVPSWMAEVMSNASIGRRYIPSKIILEKASSNVSLIRTRYQSMDGGALFYNERVVGNELKFDDIFHTIWRIFFRPSKAVATIIENQLDEIGFVPGAYTSAHLRALYAVQDRNKDTIFEWTRNALNCASQLRPGAPIFFASDSLNATIMAKKYAHQKGALLRTHTPNPNPPLHLDRCRDWQDRPTSDFYDTFVDLYLLALGGCVTFNKGGYGHWALLIGGDIKCSYKQKNNDWGKIQNKCEWLDSKPKPEESRPKTAVFLDPME